MRPKFMLFVICVETAIICFFLFGFFIHVNRFKPKFQPVFAPKFSKEVVCDSFKLDNDQKLKYEKILNEFYRNQVQCDKKKKDNFPKLHNLIAMPDTDVKEVNKLKDNQIEIFNKEISNATEYLLDFKSILNDNQKKQFCELLKNKEMHKIMPPLNNQREAEEMLPPPPPNNERFNHKKNFMEHHKGEKSFLHHNNEKDFNHHGEEH